MSLTTYRMCLCTVPKRVALCVCVWGGLFIEPKLLMLQTDPS